jgi:NAD(P)-dependent dehydrogenase (short-subunit alcohol dehydrogenase family)
MDMLLKGKRALITGSTSGIGAQCARVLAGEGVSVVINGRSADRAAAVTDEIRKVGGEAKFVLGDLTTEDGSNAVVEGANPKERGSKNFCKGTARLLVSKVAPEILLKCIEFLHSG